MRREAEFLFGEEISQYIKELIEKAAKLHLANRMMQAQISYGRRILEERAKRGIKGKFLQALDKVPDFEPEERDK